MGRLTRHCVVVLLLGAPAAASEEVDWKSIGPPVGAMTTLAVDPEDSENIYAGGRTGLFRSSDGGRVWQRLPVDAALSIAFSDSGVIYVGGDWMSYKSTDRGGSWQPIRDLQGYGVFAIVTDPFEEDLVYVMSGGGIFKSTDEGSTWVPAGADLPRQRGPVAGSLVADPNTVDMLYALVADRVFRSIDGGTTWQEISSGLPTDCGYAYQTAEDRQTFYACLLSLAVDATATLYVGTDGRGVYRSSDGGETWTALGGDIGDRAVLAIAVDPAAPDLLYVGVADEHDPETAETIGRGGGTVFRSDDGGASWRQTNRGLPEVPVVAIAVDPSVSDNVYAATDGAGVLASIDGGETWKPAERGLNGACLLRVAAVPTMPTTLVAASIDKSPRLLVSDDRGRTWFDAEVQDQSGVFELIADPNDPGVVYGVTRFGRVIIKSLDGGHTWARRDPDPFQIHDLAIDPGSPTVLYGACGPCGVVKSTDGAGTWSPAGSGLPTISQVAVDAGSGTVYATSEGVAFMSADGGESWAEIGPVPQPLFGGLTVAASAPPVLLATTLGRIYASRDGGRSWQDVNLPGSDPSSSTARVAVSPVNPNTVYAIENGQLSRSDDAGSKWTAIGNRLQHPASDLAVDPNERGVVYAATCGGSVLELREESTATGAASGDGCAITPDASTPGRGVLVHLLVFAFLRIGLWGRRFSRNRFVGKTRGGEEDSPLTGPVP